MRKIIAFLVATADGYHEGPNHEFDWPVVDAEFNEFAVAQLNEVDALLFGRATYEGMASYWPTPEAEQNDPEVAGRMNGIPKIVVSRTLETAAWDPTQIISDDAPQRLTELKRRPGGDVLLLGSSTLTAALLHAGVVDELRLMTMPVLLGDGNPLLRNKEGRIGLELISVRAFESGNVVLSYRPAGR